MGQKNHKIHIYRRFTNSGLTIQVGKKNYHLSYPSKIWQHFPTFYQDNFASTLTYALTFHLSVLNFQTNRELIYHFPPPVAEPLIFKGMFFEMTSDPTDDGIKTSDYIKLLYNAYYRIHFTDRPAFPKPKNINTRTLKEIALIPLTFGKDSLLTFALARELGIKTVAVFFEEPLCPSENKHKKVLAKKFCQEFKTPMIFFPLSTGALKKIYSPDNWWGWDLLLTQYSLLLLPYLFAYPAKYLFWSHEQSCNATLTDKEGFIINPVFEQNREWLLNLNASLEALGCRSIFASLVEPLHEIAIMYILHKRYPQIAKYQNSCFGTNKEATTRRWCGTCSKCARMYIFLKAIGVDPGVVGFTTNMLTADKKNLYSLFGCQSTDSSYDCSGIGRDEQLLAFYLAAKRGAKEPLINQFRRRGLTEAQKKKSYLYKTFFSVYPPLTLTTQLKKPLLKIFTKELRSLKI
jgi:hypothetical protein